MLLISFEEEVVISLSNIKTFSAGDSRLLLPLSFVSFSEILSELITFIKSATFVRVTIDDGGEGGR